MKGFIKRLGYIYRLNKIGWQFYNQKIEDITVKQAQQLFEENYYPILNNAYLTTRLRRNLLELDKKKKEGI